MNRGAAAWLKSAYLKGLIDDDLKGRSERELAETDYGGPTLEMVMLAESAVGENLDEVVDAANAAMGVP